MADWSLPTLGDSYSNFQDSLKARDFDAISLGFVAVSNPQQGMMRYVRASNKFQEYDGAIWQDKILSVAGGGTGANTPSGAISALGLGTMALQNANNVNITGGAISGLSSLNVNGNLGVNGGSTISGHSGFGANLSIAGTLFSTVIDIAGFANFRQNLAVSGQCDFAGLVNIGQGHVIGAGGLTVEYDIAVKRDCYITGSTNVTGFLAVNGNINTSSNLGVIGQYYAGPSGVAITSPDGKLYAGAIGRPGYSGAGTKVLVDNDTWVDANTIGGGMIEIIHQNMTFGTDEMTRTLVIPWNGPMPASANRWHIQFDQMYQDNVAENGGTIFYNLVYVGPNQVQVNRVRAPNAIGFIGPSTVYYTAFHHRTEV